MTVHFERIPPTDPRLARHIRHDERSRLYPFPTAGLSIQTVRHTRRIPVLDQGQVGSCTGNAGIGCLGTDPLYATVPSRVQPLLVGQGAYPFTEAGAVALYSAAEVIDGDGPYPPNDHGSSGLSVAKALKAAGQISGYTHTFTLDGALKALSVTPFITGINWYNSMFQPDASGRVQPDGRSGLAGGHEIVVDGYDADVLDGAVWFTNSWGAGWGLNGRFWMSAPDYGALLAQQGDVTIFAPLTAPAPVPTPGDPDTAFAAVLRHHDWIHHPHLADNAHVARGARVWLAKKGL